MKAYEAYCAVCDANVRVRLDPGARHMLLDAEIECLDRCPSCDNVVCPIEGTTPRELVERLEFLGAEARIEGGQPTTDVDLEEIIRRGRIQAMRRGNDPAC